MEAIRRLRDRDRVLLVDDEVDLTSLWREVLESTGRYIVLAENCADHAIQMAQEFRPHLIFMDRDIAGIDGGELAARLRVDAALGSVPIIFVTGSVTQREAALHGLFGGMPTLAKPFTSDALVRLAGVVLDRHWRPWAVKTDRDSRPSTTSEAAPSALPLLAPTPTCLAV